MRFSSLLACIVLAAASAPAPALAEIDFEPSWSPADYGEVRLKLIGLIDQQEASAGVAQDIAELWPAEERRGPSEPALLDRVARSLAKLYPPAATLVKDCSQPFRAPTMPDVSWLSAPEMPPFVRDNLRLFYARWLAQGGLYDEVLEQVADLQPADVVDPASLLFYRMVACHQLVMPDESRAALVRLMEREDELPQRFKQVAQLVQRDLGGLKDESLDHIARRMRDVRRRLDYGRAGRKVQAVEQSVLDSLDKRIKDLEKQQQQQQQSSAAAGGSAQSAQPMKDSQIAELKGPMQVDRKDIGHQAGWGDLPPKEREQAMQQVGREFPAHYQELIEDYFRELAAEREGSNE